MQPIPLEAYTLLGWVLLGLEVWHLEMCCVRAWLFHQVLAVKGCSLERECPSVNTEDPAKSRDHSKCHTLEQKMCVSYGTEIQPLCSGTDTWEGNELARIWRRALDQWGVWHSSPWALQHDLQFWLALLIHGRRSPGTSWKWAPTPRPGCGREAILK